MLRLPESLRSELAKPQGKLYRDGEEILKSVEEIRDAKLVAYVGDVVTSSALKCGVRIDIAVVDGKTLRSRYDVKVEGFEVLKARNPAGCISEELVETLKRSVKIALENKKVCVFVDGEEDLAAIPLIIFLPVGSVLIYGQPGEGIVVIKVDEKAKNRMFEIIEKMEKVGGDIFGNFS